MTLQIGTEEELSSVISVKHEPMDNIDLRPPKKQRVFMDAVVVPTLASIFRKRITREEKEQHMKKLQNVRAGA